MLFLWVFVLFKSVLNARLLSVEESSSRVNMGPVEPSQQPRESSIAHEQADTTTNQVTTDEAQTAWLAKAIGPGPPKVKLPPVSTKTSSKKKKRRNSKEQPRKGKPIELLNQWRKKPKGRNSKKQKVERTQWRRSQLYPRCKSPLVWLVPYACAQSLPIYTYFRHPRTAV